MQHRGSHGFQPRRGIDLGELALLGAMGQHLDLVGRQQLLHLGIAQALIGLALMVLGLLPEDLDHPLLLDQPVAKGRLQDAEAVIIPGEDVIGIVRRLVGHGLVLGPGGIELRHLVAVMKIFISEGMADSMVSRTSVVTIWEEPSISLP